MTTLQKPRIGLAGGRRIGINEMAKSDKAQNELKELLIIMEAMERENDPPSVESGPEDSKQTQQAEVA